VIVLMAGKDALHWLRRTVYSSTWRATAWLSSCPSALSTGFVNTHSAMSSLVCETIYHCGPLQPYSLHCGLHSLHLLQCLGRLSSLPSMEQRASAFRLSGKRNLHEKFDASSYFSSRSMGFEITSIYRALWSAITLKMFMYLHFINL